MYDHGHKQQGREVKSKTATQEAERRSSNRHVFTATADVVEFVTGARYSTRTMDLGPGGCFVDTTNPLAVGSRVSVKLSKGKTEFQTGGTVVYSQNGLGMGIAFTSIDDAQQAALTEWLSEVTGERPVAHDAFAGVANYAAPKSDVEARMVIRLLRLLVTKGLLTDAEASSVIHEQVL
ncbi:MAG: PilZ domain-containing protein [Candidatus Acidiferrales bacterium]